jgi:hypothetical protein
VNAWQVDENPMDVDQYQQNHGYMRHPNFM